LETSSSGKSRSESTMGFGAPAGARSTPPTTPCAGVGWSSSSGPCRRPPRERARDSPVTTRCRLRMAADRAAPGRGVAEPRRRLPVSGARCPVNEASPGQDRRMRRRLGRAGAPGVRAGLWCSDCGRTWLHSPQCRLHSVVCSVREPRDSLIVPGASCAHRADHCPVHCAARRSRPARA
jgi:hypothetical protein